MMTAFLFSLILATALILINSVLAKKINHDREKPSAFECGFDPKSSARLSFSLRFYLIAVVFLIFDVEITLIIPLPVIFTINELHSVSILASLFIIILVVGLLHEWNQGALDWK